jgi:hypothetical protein
MRSLRGKLRSRPSGQYSVEAARRCEISDEGFRAFDELRAHRSQGGNMKVRSEVKGLLRMLVLAVSAILLSACSVPFPVYSVSGENVGLVRALPVNVQVGNFQGAQKEVSCRLQPIGPEGNATFASYIQKALRDEVLIAGNTTRPQTVQISGTVKSIDLSCGIITGSWTIDVDISVNGGSPIPIRTVKTFDGNYMGAVVATRAYQAFVPSIQQLVNDILSNPAVQGGGPRS